MLFLPLKKKKKGTEELIENLVSGVSTHLASPIEEVRKMGMRVGEAFAKIMGKDLRFEELDGERDVQVCHAYVWYVVLYIYMYTYIYIIHITCRDIYIYRHIIFIYRIREDFRTSHLCI